MPDPAPVKQYTDPATGQPVQVIYALPPELLAGQTAADDGVSLTELIDRLRRGWRLIAGLTLAGAIASAVIALALPNRYTASLAALPPSGKSGGLGGALGQYADLAALAGVSIPGAAGGSTEEIMAILGSRTLAEQLVDEFALASYYQPDGGLRDSLIEAFRKDFEARADKKTSLITVDYTHTDPATAAAVANRAGVLLQGNFNRLHQSSTKRERAFLEERLAIADRDFAAAQEKLAAFQRLHRTFELEAQTKATVEAISQLQGQLIAQQVELRALLASQAGGDSPQIQLLRERIEQLAQAIERLVGGPPAAAIGGDKPGILLGLGDLPELGIQYLVLYREVKKNEALLTTLTAQVEAARIAEVRDAEAVTIIDQAAVPDRKSGPKRALICIAGTMLALLLGGGIALVRVRRPAATS